MNNFKSFLRLITFLIAIASAASVITRDSGGPAAGDRGTEPGLVVPTQEGFAVALAAFNNAKEDVFTKYSTMGQIVTSTVSARQLLSTCEESYKAAHAAYVTASDAAIEKAIALRRQCLIVAPADMFKEADVIAAQDSHTTTLNRLINDFIRQTVDEFTKKREEWSNSERLPGDLLPAKKVLFGMPGVCQGIDDKSFFTILSDLYQLTAAVNVPGKKEELEGDIAKYDEVKTENIDVDTALGVKYNAVCYGDNKSVDDDFAQSLASYKANLEEMLRLRKKMQGINELFVKWDLNIALLGGFLDKQLKDRTIISTLPSNWLLDKSLPVNKLVGVVNDWVGKNRSFCFGCEADIDQHCRQEFPLFYQHQESQKASRPQHPDPTADVSGNEKRTTPGESAAEAPAESKIFLNLSWSRAALDGLPTTGTGSDTGWITEPAQPEDSRGGSSLAVGATLGQDGALISSPHVSAVEAARGRLIAGHESDSSGEETGPDFGDPASRQKRMAARMLREKEEDRVAANQASQNLSSVYGDGTTGPRVSSTSSMRKPPLIIVGCGVGVVAVVLGGVGGGIYAKYKSWLKKNRRGSFGAFVRSLGKKSRHKRSVRTGAKRA